VKTAPATAVKNQFGQYLETALTEPVAIDKNGRRVAVMLAWKEYRRLKALEDAWWAAQAEAAEKEGYLGTKASREFVRARLHEKA
jgi:prevent-host-death family protein